LFVRSFVSFFFSSRRRHTRSVSAFLLNRSSDLVITFLVCKLLMLICILTKNVITSCSVTMMLFLHLEVKPLMTLTTVLYLSCARSEERRVGKECRYRWAAYQLEKKREEELERQE